MSRCAFTLTPGEGDLFDDLDDEWRCPHDVHDGTDHCVFHLSTDVDADGVVDGSARRDAIEAALDADDRESKRLLGAVIDHLDLEYIVLSGRNRYPLDLRGADVGELSLGHAESEVPIDLRGADVDHLDVDNAEFEEDVYASGAGFGTVDAFEATFERDADFAGATFEGRVEFDEADFDDEVHFEDATFEDAVTIRGAEFHGGSNLLDDNTSFAGAEFAADASFEQSRFEYATFREATFAGEADFQGASFDGDIDLSDVNFSGFADFDEARFDGDASFERARFEADADFRGADFRGGDRVLDADVSFVDVSFVGDTDFRHASFRGADFSGSAFAGDAMFEESTYRADVSFAGVDFEAGVDFDESRFDGDADFSAATFEAPAVFRGSEFVGEANYLEYNVTFEGAWFGSTADFDSARFTTVDFRNVSFGDEVDLSGAEITERAEFDLAAPERDVVVDLTEATFPKGSIRHPDDRDEWVAYDLTRTTVGDVRLETAAEADDGSDGSDGSGGSGGSASSGSSWNPEGQALLASVRFCETEFDGFDFSAHRAALEEADWILHEFDCPAEYEPDRELTPRATELTYLKAANAAKAQGDRDAGVEFSIKKAHHRRYKNLSLVGDRELPVARRFTKGTEVIGNYAWHAVCGYGYRLWRILAVSVVVIFVWGIMYALLPLFDVDSGTTQKIGAITDVSQLGTFAGWKIVADHVYFSLVTFTTVGYGDVNPLGWVKILAAIEGALGVLLASLVVFVLGRRVAI